MTNLFNDGDPFAETHDIEDARDRLKLSSSTVDSLFERLDYYTDMPSYEEY